MLISAKRGEMSDPTLERIANKDGSISVQQLIQLVIEARAERDALAAELAAERNLAETNRTAAARAYAATDARIRELEAALMLLTNGFKYSTEVVTIARTALSSCQPGYVEEQRGGATIRHSVSETKGDANG
jgi:hypothetical protein